MRIWNARGQDLDSESASLLGKGMGYDGDMSAYYGVPMMYNPMSGWSMCMPVDAMQGVNPEDMAQCEMVAMEGVLMDGGDGTATNEAMWADPEMAALCGLGMEADNGTMMQESMAWGMEQSEEDQEPEKKDWGHDSQEAQTNRWEESRSGHRQNNRKTWRDGEGQHHWDDHRKDEGSGAWDNWDYGWKGKGRNTRRAQRQAGYDTWTDREWP
eukprot:g6254.t1